MVGAMTMSRIALDRDLADAILNNAKEHLSKA